MTVGEFADLVRARLPYDANGQQNLLIEALARFCSASTPSDSVFIVNGYAGTGKTSLTGALVKALEEVRRPVVLLAPTGRAFAAASDRPRMDRARPLQNAFTARSTAVRPANSQEA